MLPLLRDRICVSLAPGRVGLLRFGRGWQPRLVHSEVACDDTDIDDGSGTVANRLLGEMLGSGRGTRRGEVAVVLSNHFVRYIVLPWSDIVSDEDWQALARHQFRSVYGDAALGWVTSVVWQGPERPVVACATARTLLDILQATVRNAGLRLRSVRPYFAAAYNFCRRRLPDEGFWFGVVESGRFSFGGVDGGVWLNVGSRRLGNHEARRLTEMLEQEVLGGESAPPRGRAFVFSPEEEVLASEGAMGWKLEPLSLRDVPAPIKDGRLAAALTALS